MKRPLIEACVDSYASAIAASRAGADRLELCAHLVIGGTTPTHALFRQVQRGSGVPINVLIRPRFGDFLYTEPELEEMCEEIAAFRDLGANGVVIGAVLAWSFARDAFWQSFLLFGAEVALGEAGVLFLLGMPLISLIPRIFHLERKNAA